MFALVRRNPAPIAVYLTLVAAFVTGVWWYGYAAALAQLDRRAPSGLALAADSLTGSFRRFWVLAQRPPRPPQLSAVHA